MNTFLVDILWQPVQSILDRVETRNGQVWVQLLQNDTASPRIASHIEDADRLLRKEPAERAIAILRERVFFAFRLR